MTDQQLRSTSNAAMPSEEGDESVHGSLPILNVGTLCYVCGWQTPRILLSSMNLPVWDLI
ncbi:hypothetical protein KY290_033218 [Solanum tuberosum]|uniref:Uncharacterized protein n=1 Tax=Solanum tuberosum TaxID=4113 RepID=A0ABQ7U091_SOLTU|nr:hypothetical protein KY285_032475 [Solanum tuberosum]KAH0740175.1 hypothetical protein KY290_033218 [Solanum tuberosum]